MTQKISLRLLQNVVKFFRKTDPYTVLDVQLEDKTVTFTNRHGISICVPLKEETT